MFLHQRLFSFKGLGGVVWITLPMAHADRSSRPVYYLPCSDLGQVVNLHCCMIYCGRTSRSKFRTHSNVFLHCTVCFYRSDKFYWRFCTWDKSPKHYFLWSKHCKTEMIVKNNSIVQSSICVYSFGSIQHIHVLEFLSTSFIGFIRCYSNSQIQTYKLHANCNIWPQSLCGP